MQYLISIQPKETDQGIQKLEFTLDHNPLVDIWVDCVKAQFTRPWHINHLSWCRGFSTEETLAKSFADIELSRKALNLSSDLDLNSLHLMFHKYSENNSTDYEWDLLNIRIHHLEQQIKNMKSYQKQIAVLNCVIADKETNLVEQRPILDNLREFWGYIPRSGDLTLGYYTLGKTIWNCVNDNDVECVRQNMVRPQIMVSTENLCRISKIHAPNDVANESRHLIVKNWIRQNSLEDFIDLNLPENCFHGKPKLGSYTGKFNLQEINQILTGGKIVSVELID